jgi:hypothetical protein
MSGSVVDPIRWEIKSQYLLVMQLWTKSPFMRKASFLNIFIIYKWVNFDMLKNKRVANWIQEQFLKPVGHEQS